MTKDGQDAFGCFLFSGLALVGVGLGLLYGAAWTFIGLGAVFILVALFVLISD